jgi:hypothetical protein
MGLNLQSVMGAFSFICSKDFNLDLPPRPCQRSRERREGRGGEESRPGVLVPISQDAIRASGAECVEVVEGDGVDTEGAGGRVSEGRGRGERERDL